MVRSNRLGNGSGNWVAWFFADSLENHYVYFLFSFSFMLSFCGTFLNKTNLTTLFLQQPVNSELRLADFNFLRILASIVLNL